MRESRKFAAQYFLIFRPIFTFPFKFRLTDFQFSFPFTMRRQSLRFGLYSWFPEHGYSFVHPANRRDFEDIQPFGKVFELLDFANGWLLLRYQDRQYKVKPELFSEVDKPPLRYGDWVNVKNRPDLPSPSAEINDVFWNEREGRAYYGLVQRKRSIPGIFSEEELQKV